MKACLPAASGNYMLVIENLESSPKGVIKEPDELITAVVPTHCNIKC
jgi:hypothetical protein